MNWSDRRTLEALAEACDRPPEPVLVGGRQWPVGADVGWAFAADLGLGHQTTAAGYLRALRRGGLARRRRSRRVCGWMEWAPAAGGLRALAEDA